MDILVWLALIPFEKPRYHAAAKWLTRREKLLLISYNAVFVGIASVTVVLLVRLSHASFWPFLVVLLGCVALSYPRKKRKRIILSALSRSVDGSAVPDPVRPDALA